MSQIEIPDHDTGKKFCYNTGQNYHELAYNESENQAGLYHCSRCGEVVCWP